MDDKKMSEETPQSGSRRGFIKGVINLRGKIVSVLDLRKRPHARDAGSQHRAHADEEQAVERRAAEQDGVGAERAEFTACRQRPPAALKLKRLAV